MPSFSDQLRQFSEAAVQRAELVVQKVAIDCSVSVVDGSPVGNPELWKFPKSAPAGYVGGRFRANWQVSIGSPATGEVNAIDENGGPTKAAGEAVAMTFRHEDRVVYVTNNLPYAIPLEYGHSTQAPAGMVRITVANFQGYVEQAASEARQ